jgi:arylsulfatase A-like enzyme
MKVFMLTARGLQLAALGCYGNRWIETPALDGLAARGIVFDQHFADRADPPGARRAWRTGRYDFPVPPGSAPTGSGGSDLLDALRQRGIHTHLIVDTSRPAPADFEAGWDKVEHIAASGEETALERTVQAAQKRLKRLAARNNWLLWVDLATPLPPWEVPEEFRAPYFTRKESDEGEEEDEEEAGEVENDLEEPLAPLTEVTPGSIDPEDDVLFLRLQSSYAAAVSYLDAGIGQLLETLDELSPEVLVLVTTDCGGALGEHAVVGLVRPWLHEEIIHLPLLVRLPGAAGSGRRVLVLTQAVDLAATLAAAFGVSLPTSHGHNLLALARGEGQPVRTYACAGLEVGGAIEWALRTPDWAFLLPLPAPAGPPGEPRLYVKPDDRCEVNNVLQHHLELAEYLERSLRAFVAATRKEGPLEPPILRVAELEALVAEA